MEGAGRLAASPAPPGGGSRWPGQGGHRPQHVANDGFEQIPQAQTAEQVRDGTEMGVWWWWIVYIC